jgi:Fic family protein
MKYEKLRIISYNRPDEFEATYVERFNNPTCFRTQLVINPYSVREARRITDERFPLFYLPLPELLKLEQTIYRNSKNIENMLIDLPVTVHRKMLVNYVLDEVWSSNEIEDVKSTKKELEAAAQERTTERSLPFKGIVTQYLDIIESKYEKIKTVEDLRLIYDKLFLGDIDKENYPDGNLFRARTVYVGGANNSIHEGLPSEELTVEALESLINFMNDDDYPVLAKASITHYFFEYVHPFYDGNGRFGRFILSSYLARKLDIFSGISFSGAVRESRKKYMDAFAEVSEEKNKGEITHFIMALYELIIDGQNKVLEDLLISQAQYKFAKNYLNSLDHVSEQEKEILKLYVEDHLFRFDTPIENRALAKELDITFPTLKKRMQNLIDKGMVKEIKKKPLIHALSEEFIKSMGSSS